MMRLIAALALAGCAAPPDTVEWVAPQLKRHTGRDVFIGRHMDPVPHASGNNVLFVNYDGVTLNGGNPDDSRINVSELAWQGSVPVPPFQLPAGAKYTLQQGKDSVTDRLRALFKRFDLQIVTSRPASGNYTMIAVGGKNTLIPGLTGAAGVSTLDCDDSNPNNVVYDFSEELPPDFGGLTAVAIAAAHEAGHAYGLEHSTNPADVMFSIQDACVGNNACPTIDQEFQPTFTTGNYSSFNGGGEVGRCIGRVDPVDNAGLLTTALGPNPSAGDTQAPTVQLTFPILGYVPTQFTARVNASDNNSVKRVEIYKNFELVAVLNSAPYQTVINAADGEQFALTADAFDADANHKSVTMGFQAMAAIPGLCPNGQSDCKTNQVCKMGICRYPIGTACTLDQQCEFSCKQPLGVTQTICTNTCNNSRPCPAGNMCGADNLCQPGTAMPMLKLLGESCTTAEECESSRCDGTCVFACDDTNPCGDGKTCSDVTGGQGCILAPVMPASKGCDVVPRPAPVPLFFVLLLLGLFVRQRSSR